MNIGTMNRGWSALLFLLAAWAPCASAAVVSQGYDLLETGSEATFQDLVLPPGFFGPMSDPFVGRVRLRGVPFDIFDPDGPGPAPAFSGLGPTDTIVQRMQDAGPTFPAMIDIEIVALHLESAQPLRVTRNGGATTEQWDMDVRIGINPITGMVDPPQSMGTMIIGKAHPNGGTFDSFLPVQPMLTFTQVGGPGQIGPMVSPIVLNLQAVTQPWCEAVAGPLGFPPGGQILVSAVGLTTNFLPGVICPDSPYAGNPPVSYSVDGGALNAARNGMPATPLPNPAEGLLQPDPRHLPPNDVYALGTASAAQGYASEGEVFQGAGDVLGSPVNTTNVDRMSAALGIGPTPGGPPFLGPFAPNPGAPAPAPGLPGVPGPPGSFGGPPGNTVGTLGLVPDDNVDALSYGRDSGNVALFSVDPATVGALGSAVLLESTGSLAGPPAAAPFPTNPGGGDPGAEAAGDVFKSVSLGPFGSYIPVHFANGMMVNPAVFASNLQVHDELALGLQAPAANGSALGPPEDDLDGLEFSDTGDPVFGVDLVDNTTGIGPPDGVPERHSFFSIDTASPSNGLLIGASTVSPDDILVTPPGGFSFGIYADGVVNIGLLPGDDLDALALSDIGVLGGLDPGLDEALFSLHPGSPSVLVGPDLISGTGDELSAAALFYTNFAAPFVPYATPAQLGLLFSDNLNALDILPRSPDPFLPPPIPPLRPCPCKKMTPEQEMLARHGIRVAERARDQFAVTTGGFRLETFAFGPVDIQASGPVLVERRAPAFDPETAVGTIDTEMLSLDLSGNSNVGPAFVQAGRELGLPPSPGVIMSITPGKEFPAESFFDVFYRIQVGGMRLHNQQPYRVEVVIPEVPFYGQTHASAPAQPPVDLFDDLGNLAGSMHQAAHMAFCTADADCDDGNDCTSDSCDPFGGACAHLPDPDLDGDGICDGADSCPQDPNPGQALLTFDQEIKATSPDTFCWDRPADALMVRGPLEGVRDYLFDMIQPLPNEICFFDPQDPPVGRGFYYVVKKNCRGGSWQTNLGVEPRRDQALP